MLLSRMRRLSATISLASICLISLACSSGSNAPQPQPQKPLPQQAPQATIAQQRPDLTQQQLAAMQAELAAREAKIRELEASRNQPPSVKSAADNPEIAGLNTTFDKQKRELTVTLQSDILFDPGSADLKQGSKSTLDKVAAAIKKDYPTKKIRIHGHTDKDPIVHSNAKWIDNMDLSQNRAAAVARYLKTKGVDTKNLTTVGFGETQPKATKEKSRRVEIVVVTD
jgi:outer membrane protein OmpA-like peptidoglycan-associated protein